VRVVAILIGLVLGLLGLFMSVCGGGFLASMGYDTLRGLFGAHRDPNAINGLFMLLLPGGSLVVGIVLCWSAYQILRTRPEDK
jgi:hypothetical protein